MGKTELIERLNALAKSSENRSNSARLRDIFLHVEHAIKAGVPLKLIFEELKAEGFTFTYNSFINALVKIRKEYRDNTNQQQIKLNKITKNTENEQTQSAQQKNHLVINSPQTETKKPTTNLLPDIAKKLPDDFVNPLEKVMEKYKKEQEENSRKDTLGWNSVPDLEKIYGKKE